ncbi:MAG: hypothetical protein SPD15_02350 [Allisonella histaminiformans]|uniref:hypothetical protein n=1 Tax=Allisonella histaminiformans TaxID=209880 RepID=UPI002A805BD8|nr:hypothetical protein [Allisonella histaminiformans]MDY4540302.1 hypothetical protein [Allisonella histaminiformans]
MKKRILKRIGCSLVILSSLLMGTACLNPSNAQDVLFYKSTDHIGSLCAPWIDSYNHVTFDFENEKYRFESDSQGILHLKSTDGKTDYFSFIPSFVSDDVFSSTSYYVKKIYTSNPDLQFLEIQMYQGIGTVGYWLIGKHNNNWVTYVSYDALKSIGLSDLIRVTSEVNPNRSGKMILILYIYKINEYNPGPIQIELYWNNTTNRIEMRKYDTEI